MKALLCIAAAATALVAAAPSADAARFCRPGWRMAPNGRCVPARPMMGPGSWSVGVFYPGRGYWDGRRFWMHRYRWQGGWRYR